MGFGVALGSTVFLWQSKYAKEVSGSLIRFVSGECEDFNFNAHSRNGCNKIVIKNVGYLRIDGFAIRSFSSLGMSSEIKEIVVKTEESTVLDVGVVDAEKVEMIPLIRVEDKLIGCQDKIRTVDCEGLDDIQMEACDTADSGGTCDLLGGLGIVSCEECCTHLEKCCSC